MDYFKYCPWDGYRFAENDVQCFICKRPKYQLTSHEEEQPQIKKWEKILYERQPYDDNYIDETFLSNVEKQEISNGPDYKQLISKTSDLIFTINLVVIYLISYFLLLQKLVDEILLIYVWSAITIICFVYNLFIKNPKGQTAEVLSQLKNYSIYISILLLFAPVLQSVNQTYADDTIYVLTSVSILVYLFTKDYDYEYAASLSTWKVDTSNWASILFTSLLASRLHTEIQVFVMFYSSNLLFIFAQFVKRPFKEQYGQAFRILNVAVTIILGITLITLSYFLALLYSGCVFFITFVSPLQLIWLYQYKNTIRGPWDLPNVKSYD